MSAISDLRKLVQPKGQAYEIGEVVVVEATRVIVRVGSRAINCSTLVPVIAGDSVRVQGLLIVSKQQNIANSVPVFRV